MLHVKGGKTYYYCTCLAEDDPNNPCYGKYHCQGGREPEGEPVTCSCGTISYYDQCYVWKYYDGNGDETISDEVKDEIRQKTECAERIKVMEKNMATNKIFRFISLTITQKILLTYFIVDIYIFYG